MKVSLLDKVVLGVLVLLLIATLVNVGLAVYKMVSPPTPASALVCCCPSTTEPMSLLFLTSTPTATVTATPTGTPSVIPVVTQTKRPRRDPDKTPTNVVPTLRPTDVPPTQVPPTTVPPTDKPTRTPRPTQTPEQHCNKGNGNGSEGCDPGGHPELGNDDEDD